MKVETLTCRPIAPKDFTIFEFRPSYDCEIFRIVAVEGEVSKVLLDQHTLFLDQGHLTEILRSMPGVSLVLDEATHAKQLNHIPLIGIYAPCMSTISITCHNTKTEWSSLEVRILLSEPRPSNIPIVDFRSWDVVPPKPINLDVQGRAYLGMKENKVESVPATSTHYSINVVPMNDDGSTYFMAYHPAFGQSTCSATGDTEEEAVSELHKVRQAVIKHYEEKGYPLPVDDAHAGQIE